MGLPQTPNPPHLYPQALQLKLYQAFIFSIPILFSIILFLLFYLFYLKRRASSLSSPPPILPRSSNQSTPYVASPCQIGLKGGELKDKLPVVLFDEELRTRDSQCCVCLGEFEIKEELLQVPLCKHVFHIDCIHHWLRSNLTCPLCRCCVIPTIKLHNPAAPIVSVPSQEHNINSNQHQQNVSLEQQQLAGGSSNNANISTEQQMIPTEGSSSATACLSCPGRLSQLSTCIMNEVGSSDRESVVIHIETQNL